MTLSSPVFSTDKSYIALLSFEEDRGFFLHISYGSRIMELEKAKDVQQLVVGRQLTGEQRWQESASGHSECLLSPAEAGKLYSRLQRLLPGVLEMDDGIPVQTYWDTHAESVLTGGEAFSADQDAEDTEATVYVSDDLLTMSELPSSFGTSLYAAGSSDFEMDVLDSGYAEQKTDRMESTITVSESRQTEYIAYENEQFAEDVHTEARWVLEGRHEWKNGIGQVTASPMIEISGIRYAALELSKRMGGAGRWITLDDGGQIETDHLRKMGLGPMGRMADGSSLDRNNKLTPQEIIQRGSERLRGPWEEMILPGLQLPASIHGLKGHFDFLREWGISGGWLGGVLPYAGELGEFLTAHLRDAPSCRIALIGKKTQLTTLQKMWAAELGAYWQEASVARNTKNTISDQPLIAVPVSLLTQRANILPGGVDIVIYLEPDQMTADVSSKMYKALNKMNARLRLSIFSEGERLEDPHMRTTQTSLLKLFHSVVREYAIADPEHPLIALPPAFAMEVKRIASLGVTLTARSGGFAEIELGETERGMRIPPRGTVESRDSHPTDRNENLEPIVDKVQRMEGLLQELALQGIEVQLPAAYAAKKEQTERNSHRERETQSDSYDAPQKHERNSDSPIMLSKTEGQSYSIPPADEPIADNVIPGRNQVDSIEILDILDEESGSLMMDTDQEQSRSVSAIQSAEEVFVQRAYEMTEQIEEEAEFVPFMSYWPTYESMTWRQKKWYFYWRNEVRQERYPATDLSYIFLFCYETINGAGWEEPRHGHELLMNMWWQYRQRFSKLDRYLPQWIVDFSQVHQLNESLLELLRESAHHVPLELADLEWERIWNASPVTIPFDLLSQLIDYDIQRSRFYVEDGGEPMREYIPKVLAAIDAFLEKQQGTRLIQLFRPPVYRETDRYLFRSAVYDATRYGRTTVVRRLPLTEHGPLREFLTGIVKLTENELRRQLNFNGRLRINPSVEPEIARLIERYIRRAFTIEEPLPAPRRVEIDTALLEQLQADSVIVRDMLTLREEELEAIRQEQAAEASLDDWTASIAAPTTDTSSAAYPSEAESTFEESDQLENNPIQEWSDQHKIDPPKETLNTASRNEAEQSELSNSDLHPALYTISAVDHAGHELDEEWQTLSSALQPQHIELLGVILDGADAHAQQTAAGRYGTMAALLADEINDLAMDTIGDLLLEDGAIMEEYRLLLDAIIMR